MEIHDAAVLIVDDDRSNVRALERVLRRAGFGNLAGVTDPTRVERLLPEVQPDLVVLDLLMPGLDGFAVLERIRAYQPDGDFLPVLVITAAGERDTRRRALAAGAQDFLAKPFDPVEIELRIRNLVATRLLHHRVARHAEILERAVEERTADLEEAHTEILERLARAAEFRDDETGEHTARVGDLCAAVAGAVGWDDDGVERLRRSAPLHDLGKIGISDLILLKPGKLTDEEFETIKQHTEIGARILSGSRVPLLQMAERIARHHHENWAGGGYPDGIAGEQIPLEARIVALADVFDALTHDRPYKAAWPVERALEEIRRMAGTKFDPALAEVFARTVGEAPPRG